MAEEEPAFKRRKGKEIVESIKTVEFKLRPLRFLQKSLASLTDSEFNPVCIAMVEITAKAFHITARNEETNVFATLIFQSSDLIDFHCTQPLLPHMIFLGRLLDFLATDHGSNTIEICHIDGSDRPKLSFKVNVDELLITTSDELHVDLMKIVTAPQRFPVGTPDCKAPIRTNILRKIIQHLKKERDNLVLLEVKRKVVTISVGEVEESDNMLRWEIDRAEVQTESGMEHHAMFYLRHLEAMRKASLMGPEPVLYPVSQPESVMMQFCFIGHGEVTFLFKADMVGLAPDTDSSSDDESEVSQPIDDEAETSQPGGDAVEASQHESGAAEASQPEGGPAEASQHEGGAAEASQPEGGPTEASQPEGGAAEASQPEVGPAEASQLEGGATEASQHEGGAAEASQLEGGPAETSQPEGSATEALQPEGGATEDLQPDGGGAEA